MLKGAKMKRTEMTFRELVEILELDKLAPIHFHHPKELSKNNYVYFRYLGNEEKEALINGIHDKNKQYDNSDLGVYLPDLDIKQYYEIEMKRNPCSIRYVIETISYKIPVLLEEKYLVWSVYCVLHEVGHWLDFLKSGKKSYEFSCIEKDYREELNKEADRIYRMNDYSHQKLLFVEEYNHKYREIPSEKAADNYAYSNFIIAFNKVRKVLD